MEVPLNSSDEPEKKRYFQTAYTLKTTDETKQLYAKWASVYDEEVAVEKGYQQPRRCAEALVAAMSRPGAKIIDIGCGTGLSGIALQMAGFRQIDGCDLSPDMLEIAAKTGVYGRLFETNLNEPPIDAKSEAYDAATCVGVFSYGHVEPAAIDEVLRLLKPGGIMVIGLNDHFYNEGHFPGKLEQLAADKRIEEIGRSHGAHLANVEGSTGWVITSAKLKGQRPLTNTKRHKQKRRTMARRFEELIVRIRI